MHDGASARPNLDALDEFVLGEVRRHLEELVFERPRRGNGIVLLHRENNVGLASAPLATSAYTTAAAAIVLIMLLLWLTRHYSRGPDAIRIRRRSNQRSCRELRRFARALPAALARSAALARHFPAGAARFAETDRDRLLAARDSLARTARTQLAAFALAHRPLHLLLRLLAVLRHAGPPRRLRLASDVPFSCADRRAVFLHRRDD